MTFRFYYILHPTWGIGGASGYRANPQPFTNVDTAYWKAKQCGGRVITLSAEPVEVTKAILNTGEGGKIAAENELKQKFPGAFES